MSKRYILKTITRCNQSLELKFPFIGPSLYPAGWTVWRPPRCWVDTGQCGVHLDGSNLMTDTKKGHSLQSLHPPKKVTLDREQDRQWELIKCTPSTCPAVACLPLLHYAALLGTRLSEFQSGFSSDSAQPKMPPK